MKTEKKKDLKKEQERERVQRPTFLVLDFGLHIVDSVAALHFKGDGLARQGLTKIYILIVLTSAWNS
jgi:hypothetical protein